MNDDDDDYDDGPGLELDEDGQVVLRPVLDWTVSMMAESTLLLRMRYAEKLAELQTGGRQYQMVLGPEQALEFAEALIRSALRMLDDAKRK